MVAAEAPADYAKLLFRTEPFSKMASARRFQLLSQARSVRFLDGHYVFPKGQPPCEVLLLLGGKVRMFAEIPGTDGLVLLGEFKEGSCVGWDVALADVCGVQCIAEGEVVGLLVAAPSFIEIARFDSALHESFLHRPSIGEVWWAVLSELQRRGLPIENARGIVEKIRNVCTTRDWPDEEAAIAAKHNYLWVVSGGEGVFPGTPWEDSTGVLWARLTGIPAEQFERALRGETVQTEPPPPQKKLESAIAQPPEKSPVTATESAPSESPARSGWLKSFAKAVIYLVVVLAACAAGVCGWASRQPTMETVSTAGHLLFRGDVHELNATIDGTITELRIKPGQRVTEGAVLAVIQPPKDVAKAKMLTETLAKAKSQIDFADRFLQGKPVRPNEAPAEIADTVRQLTALNSELRVKKAISSGKQDDPLLTSEERSKVNAHFDSLKADRAARVDAAQSDSSIKREDLADAEEALRDAKEELRVQTAAASALLMERGDEAKLEAASAQRAIAVYKRTVAMRQDAVNRIKKEISSIRVAPAAVPMAVPVNLDKLEASIHEAEKQIKRFSASVRILVVETELGIEQFNADSAPRQITALHPGLITEVPALAVGATVNTATLIGKIVTRQAWEIECPQESIRFMKPGQEFTIFAPDAGGAPVRHTATFSNVLPGQKKSLARISQDASSDDWRDGVEVKIEATVVTGNLLDRWLSQLGVVRL